MTLAVDFLPEAESEIEAASLGYEEQGPGLGIRFLLAIDAALRRASDNPRCFPKVMRRTRKAVIRRFPYVVFYVVEKERILVTGAFHGRRHPDSWTDRIRESGSAYEKRPEAVAAT